VNNSFVIRPADLDEIDPCVSLWVRACAARDGERLTGVGERAEAKFSKQVSWLVAGRYGQPEGFALATKAGTGAASDPIDAAVLGLLAVRPEVQGVGLGRQLLRAIETSLDSLGYRQAVLHVLADNTAAVRLYESEGWRRHGEPFDHSLLHRPSQSYVFDF
jgi:ribosomal protein S18 acetylase RimI-like enzyme